MTMMWSESFANDRVTVPVLYQDDYLLVVVKPAGLPTAPLKQITVESPGTPQSLLEAVSRFCPEVLQVSGKKAVEGGLLHRIDTATTGLVLIAKTQKAYDFLSAEQDQGCFYKTYTAVCYQTEPLAGAESLAGAVPLAAAPDGSGERPAVSVKSLFRSFGEGCRGVKPVFAESGRADRKKAGNREYATNVISVTPLDKTYDGAALYQVEASISAGYRHQVRAHLASIGLPVLGDPLYPAIWGSALDSGAGQAISAGRKAAVEDLPLYFYASGISVAHPETGKILTVSLPESFLFPLPDKNCR